MPGPGYLVLLASVVGGWWGSRVVAHGRFHRLAVSLVLGPALLTACLSTLSAFLALPSLWPASLLLALVFGFLLGRTRVSPAPAPTPHKAEYGLLLLLSLAAWLYACGSQQLFPSSDYLVWKLPLAHHLSELPPGPGFLPISSLFGRDPWAATLAGLGLLQVLVVGGTFLLALSRFSGGPLLRLTGTLYLLLSTESALLVFDTPDKVLLHLWMVAALLLAPSTRWGGALFALAMAPLSWPPALGLAVALLPARVLPLKALVVGGAVYALALKGASLPLLLALALLLLSDGAPDTIRGLALLEVWGPDWGVFGATAAALVAISWIQERWKVAAPSGFSITRRELHLPGRWLLAGAVGLILALGVKPGETVLNDDVLIGSHKNDVPLHRLFLPHRLNDWLEWRGGPFAWGEEERRAGLRMKELPGRVAFLSDPPDARLSALAALESERLLAGWEKGEQGPVLHPSLISYLVSGNEAALSSSALDWLVRPGLEPVAAAEPRASDGGFPLAAELQLPEEQISLPANSLIPLRVQLRNRADYRVRNEAVSGARFDLRYHSGAPLRPFPTPVTPAALPVLDPGEQAELTVYLRTPPRPSTFELTLTLVRGDGAVQRVPLAGRRQFRTWSPDPPHEVAGGVRHRP